jgi:hypothetical protein
MMQAAPLFTEELLDEDFLAELDALIGKDFEENKEENRNCGTGAVGGKQGFQPGNKCAGDGSKSKSKAEGKKKDVSSGNNADSASPVTKQAELAQNAYFEAVEGLHPVRTQPVTIDSHDLMDRAAGGTYYIAEDQIVINEGYYFKPDHILREDKISMDDAKGLDDVALAGRRGELVDTIAHEWGHVYDFQGYEGFDEPGRYSGTKAFKEKLYATDTYKMMDNIMNSKPLSEVDGIKTFKDDPYASNVHMTRWIDFRKLKQGQKDRLQAYWNSPREHFARAYSQYVVKNAKIKPGSPNAKSFQEAKESRTKRQRKGLDANIMVSTAFTDEEIDSFGEYFEKELAGGR